MHHFGAISYKDISPWVIITHLLGFMNCCWNEKISLFISALSYQCSVCDG